MTASHNGPKTYRRPPSFCDPETTPHAPVLVAGRQLRDTVPCNAAFMISATSGAAFLRISFLPIPNTVASPASSFSTSVKMTSPRTRLIIPTASSILPSVWLSRTALPSKAPVGNSGEIIAFSSLSPLSKTGWRRRGKKACACINSAAALDRRLTGFSGYIAVDELYDGPFCYISLVDQHRQRRLLYEVLERAPTKDDIASFLRRFQGELDRRRLILRGITTDGSNLYPEAVAATFPGVTHQICRFHVLKELMNGVLHAVAKVRKALRTRIPKRPRGRPTRRTAAQRTLIRRAERLEGQHAGLFEHRYLFVRRCLTPAEHATLSRITRSFSELRALREIVESAYSLYDRRCRTATAVEKLRALRRRVHRFKKLRQALKKLDSETVEKSLRYLDDRELPSTSNAVERGNRRHRKMQKSVYRVRKYAQLCGRIALDMLREERQAVRLKAMIALHYARAG